MKKLIVSIGSILILAFIVVLFINATESKKNTTKAKTEVTKAETTVTCPAPCNHSTGVCTVPCDPEKCKEKKCTLKDGNCDPTRCPMHMKVQPIEGNMCGSPTACQSTCRTVTVKSK